MLEICVVGVIIILLLEAIVWYERKWSKIIANAMLSKRGCYNVMNMCNTTVTKLRFIQIAIIMIIIVLIIYCVNFDKLSLKEGKICIQLH